MVKLCSSLSLLNGAQREVSATASNALLKSGKVSAVLAGRKEQKVLLKHAAIEGLTQIQLRVWKYLSVVQNTALLGINQKEMLISAREVEVCHHKVAMPFTPPANLQ